MQNFARDVIVQLKLKDGSKRVVVIVSRVIVDVRFGSGIAKFLAARRRRLDSLKIGNVLPPTGVPLVCREIMRIDVRLPMRHGARRKINKWDRASQRVIEEKR